jgi:hypothetical protein
VIEFLQANWLTLVVVGGFAAAFALLRNRPTRIGSVGQIVGNGQPVVVEIFSNT